jgi:hypothetical protein
MNHVPGTQQQRNRERARNIGTETGSFLYATATFVCANLRGDLPWHVIASHAGIRAAIGPHVKCCLFIK